MNTRELLAYLCEDPTHEAAAPINRRITESRRFHTFAADNRAKIRKKIRTATTPETLRSVLLELEVARRLVVDPRCVVEYERYGQGKVRSPDLTVTFRARTVVNVEVTQLQSPDTEASQWDGKLIGLVCHKLGQLMPESQNVLVLASESSSLTVEHVARAMKRLKAQIEQREGDFLSRFGFSDRSGFFKQFQRLGGILVWKCEEHEVENSLWTNPQAKHPIPAAVVTLFTECMKLPSSLKMNPPTVE